MGKFYNTIKNLLSTYKESILKVENKNLTTGSKVTLVVFILIIFLIIGEGVDMQQSSILKPSKQFSYKCTNFIEKNKEIDSFQNRDISQDIYGISYKYKYWELEDFIYNHQRKSERDILLSFGTNELCQKLGKNYLDIANSDDFQDKLIIQKGLKKNIDLLNRQIKVKTDEYSNTLLENIAKQESKYSILSTNAKTIKEELKKSRKKLNILEDELSKIEDIKALKEFQIFKQFLDNNTKIILAKEKESIKYYRFKSTINIFIFLFPVWLLFYITYRILKRKNFFITSHLSLNVANVAALYIVFNLFLLVYTIIPKIFLSKLIIFLSQYNLTLLLNIMAILFFMALFGYFISKIQRDKYKDTNENEVINKRLKRLNCCTNCGNFHHTADKFCGFCSHTLQTKCTECNQIVEKDYKFCTNCGYEKVEEV